jgi:hypothetical protein
MIEFTHTKKEETYIISLADSKSASSIYTMIQAKPCKDYENSRQPDTLVESGIKGKIHAQNFKHR